MASLSQLSARLVDLFGSPVTANPTKLLGNLGVSPNGNVLVGSSTDTTTNKLQVTGGIVANGYDTGSLAQFRMVQGNYGAMLRQDGTSVYLLSTPSGSQYASWNSYRPITYNMTTGALSLVSDGSGLTVGGPATFDQAVTLANAGTYSPYLIFNANGYAPFMRSNSSSGELEWVNSANTAYNMTLSDGGVLSLPRARPNWAGCTPWDTGNLNPGAYMPTSGGTFSGAVNVNGNMNAYGYMCRAGEAGGTSNIFNLYWSGSSCYLYIDTSQIGVISTTSDQRLKHSIDSSENALERLTSLRPVKYRYKEQGIFKDDGVLRDGFLAQEVQPVIPSAVHGEPDAVDDKGAIQPQILEPLPILSVTVGAVQELLQMVQQQAGELKALREELEALKANK
jgi:hypothetical protein